MEKILFVPGVTKPSSKSIDFACYLGELTKSEITGVFVDSVEAIDNGVPEKALSIAGPASPQSDGNIASMANEIAAFNQACERRSARHTVHIANNEPIEEIIRESRYADLLVLSPDISFSKTAEGQPSSFLKELLRDVECPVAIAPENFEGIEEIIFTYDDSRSAMFAIKQFCYLFPKLDETRVILLQVDDGKLCPQKDREYLKEWMSNHYSSIGYETLQGNSKTALLASLLKKKNAFIVMGAYSRSTISQFFEGSHADLLIQTLDRAFFIAHY